MVEAIFSLNIFMNVYIFYTYIHTGILYVCNIFCVYMYLHTRKHFKARDPFNISNLNSSNAKTIIKGDKSFTEIAFVCGQQDFSIISLCTGLHWQYVYRITE